MWGLAYVCVLWAYQKNEPAADWLGLPCDEGESLPVEKNQQQSRPKKEREKRMRM